MKSLPRLFAVLVFPLVVLSALSGCSGVPQGGGNKTLTSIAVTPAAPAKLKVGATQQFTATGTYSDASTADITSTVTWASSTPATATISAGGLATGVAAGTTSITAALGTVTSPGVTLTVISLSSIAITPNPASVAVAGTVQFTATGTYSDASTSDITTLVTWSSLPTTSATIGANTGLATGVANGTAQISAVLGSIVAPNVTLTVGTGGVPVPVAVRIQQVNPTIAIGNVEDFTAVALLSDGTTAPLGTPATWSSATAATATILANAGIASGLAAGTSVITATSGTLAPGTTTLTVAPAVARFAYVAGLNDGSASAYVVNSAAGTLTPFGVVHDSQFPAQVVLEPSGKYAYGPGNNGNLSLYLVDAASGALTNTSTTFPTGANGTSFQSIVDPTGRFLYTINNDSSSSFSLTAFSIDNATGNLTFIATYPVGNFPVGVAEDRLGKFVYVVNDGDDTISGFSVGATGALTALSTPTFATGSAPGIPAMDPTSSFLYVPNTGDNTISVYSIPGTGLLAPVVGSPFSIGVGNVPIMVAVAPSNKFLYVTNGADNTVSGLSIHAGGALGAAVAGSPFATGASPFGLAVDPAGTFVAVANNTDNSVSFFQVNSTTGVLATPNHTIQTHALPQFINLSAGVATAVIAPATVEAANSTSNDVSSFTVAPATGILTAGVGSPTPGLAGNNQVFATQDGKFFYTASTSAKKISGFKVDGTAGLTALASNATDLGGDVPGGIYGEPGDQFVYVADSTANSVKAYLNDPTTGLSALPGITGLGTVNTIVGDPQGLLLIALGSSQLQPLFVGAIDGSLAASTADTSAGNWTAGAIDESGHFLVAVDSTTKQIWSFAIAPIVNKNTPPDGTLTLNPGSHVSIAGTGPYSLTFDPLNRFVFVADFAAGTVKVFSFASATGLTTAVGAATTVSVLGITNVAVDATGTYLFVGVKGNTPTVAGSVAVYTIGGTGTLTPVAGTFTAGQTTAGVAVTNSVQ